MSQDVRDTDTRCRIVQQAEEFFRIYGYQKTTVADIAKALRMSPANIYRFFDSKKSINEEVALRLMGEVEEAAAAIANETGPATDRFRRFLRTVHEMNASRYVGDRKMHEMVRVALDESWPIVASHIERLDTMMTKILVDGVAGGEFKVKNPVVASRCVHASMMKFCHPAIISEGAGADLAPALETPLDCLLAGVGSPQGGV